MRKWIPMLMALVFGLLLALPFVATASDAPTDPISVMQASDTDPPNLGLIIDHVAAMQNSQAQSMAPVLLKNKGSMIQVTPVNIRNEIPYRWVRSPMFLTMEVDGFGHCMKPGHNHPI